MKKKLLPILLVVVIVFNFIFCNGVYADEGYSNPSRYGGNSTIKGKAVQDLMNNGKDSQGNTFSFKEFGSSLTGVLMQLVAGAINTIPMIIQGIVSIFTLNPSSVDEGFFSKVFNIGIALGNTHNHFTIERAVFNEVAIFNINVFNQEDTFTNGIGEHTETIVQSSMNLTLKESAASWFYTCRMIAMMINLCVLIYVGIRMALSTVASEEAKYKKMLIGWLESMVVLFLLHYIMMIIISVQEVLINILNDIRYTMIDSGETGFEDIILDKIYNLFSQKSGIQYLMYSVFFWFLTALHLKFFLTYIKRTFIVMFLTIVAPFITVTYSIDKMGDGKAQAFEIWMQEYLINVFIQPIHAAIYLVFVFTAGKIAVQAPFVAMIFLLALGTVEKIIRNIFGLKGGIKNVDEAREKKGNKKGNKK